MGPKPKKDAVTFGSVVPTEAEQKAAAKVVDEAMKNEKLLKSKMNSMRQWILNNKDQITDSEEVLGSRGDTRRGVIKAFLVLQMREKDVKKNRRSSQPQPPRTKSRMM